MILSFVLSFAVLAVELNINRNKTNNINTFFIKCYHLGKCIFWVASIWICHYTLCAVLQHLTTWLEFKKTVKTKSVQLRFTTETMCIIIIIIMVINQPGETLICPQHSVLLNGHLCPGPNIPSGVPSLQIPGKVWSLASTLVLFFACSNS